VSRKPGAIHFFGAEFTKVWARRRGAGAVPTEAAVPLTEEARAEQGIAPETQGAVVPRDQHRGIRVPKPSVL